MLKPETIKKLRTALKMGDDVADTAVAERAAEVALAPPPEDLAPKITALTADVTKLTGERDNAVLALSAAKPKDLDPMAHALISRAFKVDREQVIASGVVSEAGMKELETLCGVGDTKGIALSLSAGSTDPFFSRICDILKRNPGVKTNNGLPRPGVSDAQRAALMLDAGGEPKPITPERKAELLEMAGIRPSAK